MCFVNAITSQAYIGYPAKEMMMAGNTQLLERAIMRTDDFSFSFKIFLAWTVISIDPERNSDPKERKENVVRI